MTKTTAQLRAQNWKKMKIETKSFSNTLNNINTELNELIYTRTKLVCDKIGISQGNTSKNTTWIGNLTRRTDEKDYDNEREC